MTVKKEIIYPVFLECASVVDSIDNDEIKGDYFWKLLFEDLSYGKPPQCTYLSKGHLCCSYKDKEFSYQIERKDPTIILLDIYTLLTEKIGIQSQQDRNRKKIEFKNLEKSIKENNKEWLSIKKKSTKDVLYENFVLKMRNLYNLDMKQCKYILSFITICLGFKTIGTKDIIFDNDKIAEIRGIRFSEGKFDIDDDLKSLSYYCPSTSEGKEIQSLSEHWEYFLKTHMYN